MKKLAPNITKNQTSKTTGHMTGHVTVEFTTTFNTTELPTLIPEKEDSQNAGVIAGAIAGALIVVLVFALLALFVLKRRYGWKCRKSEGRDPKRTDSVQYEGSLQQETEYYNAKDQSYSPLQLNSSTQYYSAPSYDYALANQNVPYKGGGPSENIPDGKTLSVEHEYITVIGEPCSPSTGVEQTSKINLAGNKISTTSGKTVQVHSDSGAKDSEPKVSKTTGYFHKLPGFKGKHFTKNVTRSDIKEKGSKPAGKKTTLQGTTDALNHGEIRRVRSIINYFNKRST